MQKKPIGFYPTDVWGHMRVLVHICCAPCFTYPHKALVEEGHEVTGFWYNPNIQPFEEYRKRLETLQRYQFLTGAEIIYRDEYPLEEFLTGMIHWMDEGKSRCEFCYRTRLERTAREAKEMDFDAFSTSLTLSKYQPVALIKKIGEEAGRKYGIPYLHRDFRVGWKESIKISKELDLYRQPYCGCIFSERDRYYRKLV